MSFNDPEAFLDHIAATPALQTEFTSASSDAEITRILQREGVTCTPADIREAFLERYGSELNEEQLEAIAGGASTGAVVGAAVIVGGGVFIGTAIAVGASLCAAGSAFMPSAGRTGPPGNRSSGSPTSYASNGMTSFSSAFCFFSARWSSIASVKMERALLML